MVQPFEEEPGASNEDLDKDSQRDQTVSPCGVKVKIRKKTPVTTTLRCSPFFTCEMSAEKIVE